MSQHQKLHKAYDKHKCDHMESKACIYIELTWKSLSIPTLNSEMNLFAKWKIKNMLYESESKPFDIESHCIAFENKITFVENIFPDHKTGNIVFESKYTSLEIRDHDTNKLISSFVIDI